MASTPLADDVTTSDATLGGIEAILVETSETRSDRVVLYLRSFTPKQLSCWLAKGISVRSFRPGILARYTATRPIAGVVSGHDRLRWRSSKGGTTK
jgi:hypothetical protein